MSHLSNVWASLDPAATARELVHGGIASRELSDERSSNVAEESAKLLPMVDRALAWAARGFRVFPLPVGAKEPPPKGWQRIATDDPNTIKQLWADGAFNIGCLATGIVVDIDDKGDKTGSLDWELLGYMGDTLAVETPTGGRHLYYDCDTANTQPRLSESIDIRAAGLGYTLAPGSIVGGKEYKLLKDLPRLVAPEALAAHCRRPPRGRVDNAEKQPIGEQDSDEAILRATSFLEARDPAVEGRGGDKWTYDTANLVMDLGLSPAMCHELMAEHWNDRCSPQWELEGPNSLRTKVESAYNSRESAIGCASPEAEFGNVAIPPIERKQRPRGKWLYRHGDKVAFDKQWLLYRRLPLVGTMMIVGPSGGGKTFFCADLARAIAKGESFFGVEPDERGGVALFAAEGVAGLPGRISVLGEERLPIWGALIAGLRSQAEKDRILELLDDASAECLEDFGCPLRVIAIDTLAASGLLEDENDNGECARAVKFLEQLASRFNCLVIVTHHPPKNGNGARGGSALHAGFDTVVEIHHDGKQPIRRAECTKSRDAPTGDWGCFRLEPHLLGVDSRGREETTCTICVATADARSAAALFMDPKLVDAIVEAVGEKTWRKDHQSNESSIIDLIAKCAGLDASTDTGLRTAKLYLGSLLASGTLIEEKERIGGKDRPVVRAPREAAVSH